MSLSEHFNGDYNAVRQNDNVLRVNFSNFYYYYDFAARMMIMMSTSGTTQVMTTPFSQIDREVLVGMRDKLIELKGNPPELSPEAPANPGAQRKLNP